VKSEERKNTRFPHLSAITREDVVSGIHYGATMYNFSKDGLYFEADYLLEPDDEIFIGIENSPYASAPGAYECYRAKVRWRKDLDTGRSRNYGYGVQFYYPNYICPTIIEEEIPHQRVLQVTTPGKRDYSREYPRRPYVKKIIFASNNRFYQGLIKNISRKGIFIEVHQTFSIGQQLTLVVPLVGRPRGIKLKGKVVWSSAEGFGLEFLAKDTV
jgi:Tfp pilus assembly protein PilZ